MNYHPADIAALLSAVPRLLHASAAPRFLRHVVETGHDLQATLTRYPHERYEPLDFHYVCLQSLAVLDEALISDLMTWFGPRGREWAALLIALCPRPEFAPYIPSSQDFTGPTTWVFHLARRMVEGADLQELEDVGTQVAALRKQLTGVPLLAIRLRAAPSAADYEGLALAVRKAYRERGVDAALEAISRGGCN